MNNETRVAVLVDCDNTNPAAVEFALRMVAKFGRVVVKRGYGNHATLANSWRDTLVSLAFTPCLQYQYAAGKNTADMALALDALEILFDQRADCFFVVTSDSDFVYLCRKLRERGATVYIVGEAKTPTALRNASDQFFEWMPPTSVQASPAVPSTPPRPKAEAPVVKRRPKFVVEAVTLLASDTPEGKVHLSTLGQYLRRTNPEFSPAAFGYSGLLEMIKSYDLIFPKKEDGGHYTVRLAKEQAPAGEQI
ncbi:NYN domain-containing protein [Massilia sp. IC2-476]|uniref:NYN domain-containing protein n=1 Tax=Massilia sp. IC2-476 TaxID=2887199 RepID=UPI001D1105FB|nr:NYN domain-containing protein [Massilia sp. IC2-476]MCC2974875.1 NYN domain-containing protein [Massilia sp. IC2-476]